MKFWDGTHKTWDMTFALLVISWRNYWLGT